jgi:hypothetical protein
MNQTHKQTQNSNTKHLPTYVNEQATVDGNIAEGVQFIGQSQVSIVGVWAVCYDMDTQLLKIRIDIWAL